MHLFVFSDFYLNITNNFMTFQNRVEPLPQPKTLFMFSFLERTKQAGFYDSC